MGHSPNCCGVFSFILSIICDGLLGVALGSTHWLTPDATLATLTSLTNEGRTFGLFQNCEGSSDARTCTWISWNPEEAGLTISVTRGILITGAIILFFGIFVGLLGLCSKDNKMSSQGGLNVLACVFILVGCSVYTALVVLVDKSVSNPPNVQEFGFSFYICWVTGALLFFTGIFGLNGDRQTNDVSPTAVQAQMVWATTGQGQTAVISPHGQQKLALVKL